MNYVSCKSLLFNFSPQNLPKVSAPLLLEGKQKCLVDFSALLILFLLSLFLLVSPKLNTLILLKL